MSAHGDAAEVDDDSGVAIAATVAADKAAPRNSQRQRRLPVRELDDFWFALSPGAEDAARRYAPLDALDGGTSLLAGGTALFHEPETAEAVFGTPPSSRASQLTLHVSCWNISYGATPAVWVVTDQAWYRLRRPAAVYAAMFAPVAVKIAFATRCAALAPKLSYREALATLLLPLPRVLDLAAPSGTESEGTQVHEADLLKAGDFVVGQMRALAAATFALQEQPPPGFVAVAAPPEPDFVVKLDARVQLAGLRANLPAPVARGPVAVTGATARKASSRGGAARNSRPQPKAAAPLPPRVAPFPQLPELDLVPHAAVWEVLMLWDMGNTFASLLQLPPFSLDRAAAAFWDCRPLAPSPLAGARAAAATLFSDFCCGLARVIKGERTASLAAGVSLTTAHQEGITASALETALGRVAWPAHVADLFGRTDMDDDGDGAPAGSAFSAAATEALSAALEADADCWDALEPAQRLALATSLADAASGSDAFREHFNAAYEAAQASQRLGRVPANPVRQSAGDGLDTRAAAEEGAHATLDEAAIHVARTWEDAAADRSLLRRGQPVGVDELGNRYYELGAAAGANTLFVAHPAGAIADSGGSAGCALLDFGSAPRWSTVASGSRAAAELATWLLPRRCAGEHAPKAFCERLAASAGQAPGFAAPAPVHDGYTAFESASAALPGGLLGARRVVEALARRVHFWQLPANELAEFAADLRKFSEQESAAFSGEYSLDIVAAHAVSVCSRLTASRTLPAAVWDSSARHVWQDLLAEAVTAPQLGVALAYLHAALEAADSAAAHGAAAVVMDRPSFLLAAAQHDPTLWIPAVGDDVAVLRAGLLRTWRCLSKSWGVAPPAGLAPVTRARILAASYRRAASGSSYGKRAAAWLLLDAGDGASPFVAPVLLAEGATECVLRYQLVADALAKPWARGDAITIPIVEDDSSTRLVPGVVVKLREDDADPWESVRIRCRPETAGELHRSAWVSPWELSSDAAAGSHLDAEGGLLLELPTSDEDEELDEPSSSSSSGAAPAVGPSDAALHRKLPGRRSSGGKAKLRRGLTSARPVPVPLGASAASVATATRQLLAEIQSGDPKARPAPGDEAAARLAGMKEFWRRYRAYWQPRGGTPRVPIFARMELELWPAFQAVASRGGYDAVGASKQWIAVARSLPGRDLSTATSASFSMRVAYERSVFAFERSAVALLLGQPDPFPASTSVAAAVAEVCGHDERNRRKSGGAAAAARKPTAPTHRPKRTRSDDEETSSDDDDAAAAAPSRRPPARAAARGRGVGAKSAEEEEEDWDLAGVAAGRRARKRVCYKDTDSEEQEGAPAAVRKPAAKAAGRRRAPRSGDEDEEEEEEETSDDADSDDDGHEDGDEDGDEDAEPEAVEKSAEEEKSSSGESDGAVLRYRSASRHKARRRVVIDDDDDDDA